MKRIVLSLLILLSCSAYADDFTFINKTVTPLSLLVNQVRCTQPVRAKSAILYVANYMIELCSDNPAACQITIHRSRDCSGDAIASAQLVDGKLMEIGILSQLYHIYGNREENIVSLSDVK